MKNASTVPLDEAPRCGAALVNGKACQQVVVGKGLRCRYHGGLSGRPSKDCKECRRLSFGQVLRCRYHGSDKDA